VVGRCVCRALVPGGFSEEFYVEQMRTVRLLTAWRWLGLCGQRAVGFNCACSGSQLWC
jgi:hypothetical protein